MATIIFDFDGTIADSFDYVANFLESHTRRTHHISTEERTKLRGMTMLQMAEYFGAPKWYLPVLFIVGRRSMSRAIYNVPMFEGMQGIIDKLHAEGHELLIVSSNNRRNIRKFLKVHHLYKYFTDIYGDAGFFGKKRAIERLLKRNKLDKQTAWYIGDESRDVIASNAADIRVIAVTWGFDSPEVLAGHNPTATANEPKDIIRILEEM